MDDKCYVKPVQKTVTQEEMAEAKLAMFAVEGMGCRNCATRVQNRLISLNGVLDASVSYVFANAEVIYNSRLVTIDMLVDAVAQAGNDGKHEYRAKLYG